MPLIDFTDAILTAEIRDCITAPPGLWTEETVRALHKACDRHEIKKLFLTKTEEVKMTKNEVATMDESIFDADPCLLAEIREAEFGERHDKLNDTAQKLLEEIDVSFRSEILSIKEFTVIQLREILRFLHHAHEFRSDSFRHHHTKRHLVYDFEKK